MSFETKYKVHSLGLREVEKEVELDGEKIKAKTLVEEAELVLVDGSASTKLQSHKRGVFAGWSEGQIVNAVFTPEE